MPFVSEAQRRFMWLHHPEIAQRWAKEFGMHKRKKAKAKKPKKPRK